MGTIKIPNPVIPDSVHRIDEDYTEEYKKLVKEANKQIEAGRRRELKTWKDAKNFIAMDAFMEKLENDTLAKASLEKFFSTEEVITSQLSDTRLLESGMMENTIGEEQRPKLVRINRQK